MGETMSTIFEISIKEMTFFLTKLLCGYGGRLIIMGQQKS